MHLILKIKVAFPTAGFLKGRGHFRLSHLGHQVRGQTGTGQPHTPTQNVIVLRLRPCRRGIRSGQPRSCHRVKDGREADKLNDLPEDSAWAEGGATVWALGCETKSPLPRSCAFHQTYHHLSGGSVRTKGPTLHCGWKHCHQVTIYVKIKYKIQCLVRALTQIGLHVTIVQANVTIIK